MKALLDNLLKKSSLLLIFTLFFTFSEGTFFAQPVTLSGGLNLNFPNENLKHGYGLNIFGEYDILQHYAARLNASFTISNFDKKEYFASDMYTLLSLESDFLYYPSRGSIQYYFGLGLGYYLPSTSIAGNSHFLTPKLLVSANDLENSLGYNILGGIKFFANNPLSVNLEIKYLYLKSNWTAHISGFDFVYHSKVEDNLNLSGLATNLFLSFRL